MFTSWFSYYRIAMSLTLPWSDTQERPRHSSRRCGVTSESHKHVHTLDLLCAPGPVSEWQLSCSEGVTPDFGEQQ